MKLLILGAKGMLGQALTQVFKDLNPTLFRSGELDITKENEVLEKITKIKPDVIINAAAYTKVDKSEDNRELAFLVNGQALGYLAKAAKKVRAVLVHYSTDYVFKGDKKKGYLEDEETSPLSVYGRSKEIGEKQLFKNTDTFYLIRTSWLYGKGGQNFVDTMLKLAQEKDEIKVVNDQFGKPTYSDDLAKRTREIIENKEPFGIYHLTNEGYCSWYEFAKEIFKIKNIKTKVIPATTEKVPRPAKRPKYSILNNTKLKKSRDWKRALRDYLLN